MRSRSVALFLSARHEPVSRGAHAAPFYAGEPPPGCNNSASSRLPPLATPAASSPRRRLARHIVVAPPTKPTPAPHPSSPRASNTCRARLSVRSLLLSVSSAVSVAAPPFSIHMIGMSAGEQLPNSVTLRSSPVASTCGASHRLACSRCAPCSVAPLRGSTSSRVSCSSRLGCTSPSTRLRSGSWPPPSSVPLNAPCTSRKCGLERKSGTPSEQRVTLSTPLGPYMYHLALAGLIDAEMNSLCLTV
mmetsp:Transcript_16755/g.52081  ORF Transcript_16755/g.52081 Transcript_16755/m.52081 type:complete len:246 (-) Transcript_16755:1095-1832(-)